MANLGNCQENSTRIGAKLRMLFLVSSILNILKHLVLLDRSVDMFGMVFVKNTDTSITKLCATFMGSTISICICSMVRTES